MLFDQSCFKDKTVLITGGSRGIGKGLVKHFAKYGAHVIFTYRQGAESSQDLVATLSQCYQSQNFTAYQCDLSDEVSINALYDRHLDDLDRIDILVNNAGVTNDGLTIMMTSDQWEQVIQTNLNGTFYLTKKIAFKMLRQKNSSIINISSVSGVYGNAGQCNYSAAKAGLIGFTKALSKELASRDITVNAIAPGFIDTDMTRSMAEVDKNKIIEKIALKKLGQIDDVAAAVCFLSSAGARYITGQTLVVDGGLVI